MKKLWKPALLIAALAIMAIGMINSGAWWTDTKDTSGATIASGTLKLKAAGFTNFDLGDITGMAPGDLTDPVVITIENDGTEDLAWFGDLVVGTSILRDVIYIEDAEMKFLTPVGANWEVDGPDHFITEGKGSGNWPTVWGGLDNYATLAAFDGNSTMAPGTRYEFMGALRPGYKYQLTLKFGFHPGAGNQYQAAGPLNLSFHVDATQINAGALSGLFATGASHLPWLQGKIILQTP